MSNHSVKRIKEILERNFGDVGVQMLETSLKILKIHEKPSQAEIQKLTSDIEEKLVKLYGAEKSKEFIDQLNKEIAMEEKGLKSELKVVMDDFFTTKGIPGESDIIDQVKNLVSNGYEADENRIYDTLKQLSRERIISALNDSVINNEIKSFLDKFQSYTQSDLEDFINYMKKITKLNVNEAAVKDMVEMERLYRKFDDLGQEDPGHVKICRQYIALFNSSKKDDYNYLTFDESYNQLMKKIAS